MSSPAIIMDHESASVRRMMAMMEDKNQAISGALRKQVFIYYWYLKIHLGFSVPAPVF